MRKQYIKIGNELFELKESVAFTRIYKTLNDCYTRPSNTKKEIYDFWLKWFYENSNNALDFITIYSYNTYMFTLVGSIEINNVKYRFYITPFHNLIAKEK